MRDPIRTPPGHLHRPRLTQQILNTDPGGVCVISSAPGYGATSAVRRALKSGDEPATWVHLDARTADGDARSQLRGAVAGLPAESPLWLVVDGVEPDHHPGLVSDLASLARGLPEPVRLIVTSHGRLSPLTVASGGRAVALDEGDLRFDPDEAIELLNSIHPDMDVEVSTPLLQLAEGWAAALVAAATKVRTHGDGDWLARSGPATLLHGWFAELPAAERDFLRETSVLDLLSSGAAEAVTGRHDAGSLLLSLEARRAFLTEVSPPAGHVGRWWNRHALLTRLLQDLDTPDRTQRHSRAAEWFEAAADVDRTMHHLIAAGRSPAAGAYLTRHESDLFTAGHADRVLQWYERLPAAWGPRTTHLLRLGWGRTLSGDIRGADAVLARLRTDLTSHMADMASTDPALDSIAITGEVALLEAYLASFHADPATMIASGRTAMADLAGRPPTDSQQLAPLLVARGLLWSGRPQDAELLLDRVADQPFPTTLIRESTRMGTRAAVSAANGDITRARVEAQSAMSWLDRQGLDPVSVMQYAPVLADGLVALHSADLRAAEGTAVAVATAAERSGHLGEAVRARLLLAEVEAVRGDLGAARRTLTQARELGTTDVPTSAIVTPLDLLLARVRILAGDLLRAERLVRSLPPGDQTLLLLARIGLVSRPTSARRALESIQPQSPIDQAERHLLLAESYLGTSRRLAQGHLRKAAAVAHHHGLGLLLVHSGRALVALATATALEHHDDRITWLLTRRDLVHDVGGRPAVRRPHTRPALSPGELQLLELLPSRAGNAALAATLGVSINTIKTRLRRLYAKLGASNRDDAVQRATHLGLTSEDRSIRLP